MPHSINTQWFVDRLAERRLSQRGLAKLLNLDSSAVSLMFRGRRQMKLTEAADIARLIGAPLEDVLQHAGVREASMGKEIVVSMIHDEHGEAHQADEPFRVPAPAELPEDCIAIQARTGDFRDGWLLFLRQPKTISTDAAGRFCLSRLRKGVMIVGQVKRSYRPGRFTIEGGDGIMTDVELEWSEPILLIQPV